MEAIITAFEDFMAQHGHYYSEFYVGIASDPVDRLINGHGCDASTPHIYWTQPLHTTVVRAIENSFLDKGTKGGPGGGGSDTCYIYVYKIMPQTRE